ncbi:MAG: helix-turn-helix transcriptional regulator, partial [Trebonia sp.]|uniref:helix-turn-helix domain-containing protein n=1 Tax=Trebonia sp. TaxID=2767075 RepID=UPI003CA82E58
VRNEPTPPEAPTISTVLPSSGASDSPRCPRAATAANPAGLTRREAEVLQLVAAGLSNTDIAARLVVSDRTVDNHVSAIFRKLGARTRGEASARAVRLGLAGSAGDEVA